MMNTAQSGVWTIPEIFAPNECARLIDFSERIGFSPATVSTARGPRMLPQLRNNDRVIIDDKVLAEKLWGRVRADVPQIIRECKVVGLNERLRFYRYDSGQAFGWHHDGCFERQNGERSRLTLLIYLSDEVLGGETEFEKCHVDPTTGTALLFEHQLLHRGAPVRGGRKYVLRTDVMYTP